MSSSYVLFTFFTASSSVHYGESIIHCYRCISNITKSCKDPFNRDYKLVVECTEDKVESRSSYENSNNTNFKNYSQIKNTNKIYNEPSFGYCVKIIFKADNVTHYARGCLSYWDATHSPCAKIKRFLSDRNETLKFCNVCNVDYCNSATSQKLILALLLSSLYMLLSC